MSVPSFTDFVVEEPRCPFSDEEELKILEQAVHRKRASIIVAHYIKTSTARIVSDKEFKVDNVPFSVEAVAAAKPYIIELLEAAGWPKIVQLRVLDHEEHYMNKCTIRLVFSARDLEKAVKSANQNKNKNN
jgi:hypothetical protein